MSDTLEYIEAYFQQTLDKDERQRFELKCTQDEDFAREVAFYVTARQTIKEALLEQKRAEWKQEDDTEEKLPSLAPVKKLYQRKWFMYAAACILLVLGVYFFERPPGSQQIATTYIEKNYGQISQTMGNDKDSIQAGIAAYNNKDYNKALVYFNGVADSDPVNSDAKKYAGLVYLVTKDFDRALQQFDALANMKGLFSNPGMFLKAVTLMERNGQGDNEQAKQLLQQVVDQKLDGSTEANQWLKSM